METIYAAVIVLQGAVILLLAIAVRRQRRNVAISVDGNETQGLRDENARLREAGSRLVKWVNHTPVAGLAEDDARHDHWYYGADIRRAAYNEFIGEP